ncbi:sulfatase [Arenibacter sp. F26102]|uniref:sulfatase family protein n=1 Tax=Arenibacter sp. F26102 TaxID=2926416 RepID=UPI001FF11814|nr:sulfatase [Arenibacter sp. F26102]MCK0148084.1 sulfatase [Arenibacter sp. F26102]
MIHRFLKMLMILFVFVSFSCKEKVVKNTDVKKPLNVVLVLTDDQGGHLSALGTKGINTPNADSLAKNGVMFTNAFAVVPSCSPSRGSIMTGMYPHANGHWRNTFTPKLSEGDKEFTRESSTIDKVGVHEYIQTLPELLHENGYFTAITQKFHMSPPWKFPYSSRNAIQNNPKEFKNVISSFIDEAGDQPFFFQANIAPPHRNLDTHMEEFPEFLPNKDSIVVPEYLPDTAAMREDLAKYYGSVQLADACTGSIIEILREKGLLENTLIIFTSDQGEPYQRAKASPYYAGLHVPYIASGPGVEKNKVSNALISHIDIMPTVLDYLNIDIPETVQGNSLIPIFSGTTDKVSNRNYVFGEHNSHGPNRAEHYPSRVIFDGRFYYIQNLMHDKTYELPADLMVEDGWGNGSYQATLDAKESHSTQYKLLKQLESGRPFEELYDIENDPGQLVNLAGKKQYSEVKRKLKKALEKWRVETGDLADDPLEIKTRQTKE